jgi:phosphohistidine phosphatase SixA
MARGHATVCLETAVLYLVRHAEAGDKRAWTGPDAQRPLTPIGWRQAHGLSAHLDGHPITTIVSSPARRCLQTVAPLAQQRTLGVRADARLLVDGDAGDALRLLWEAPDGALWCTHGELIGEVLARLRARGAPVGPAPESAKGSIWHLDVIAGRVVSATYRPPPIRSAPSDPGTTPDGRR